MSAHATANEETPVVDKRFWPERLQKLRSKDPAIRSVLKGFYKAAARVVENDTEGRCVTTDVYSLGLNAARKHKVNHVRLLTAIIDLAWGQRDYARGRRRYDDMPNFTPWISVTAVSEEAA